MYYYDKETKKILRYYARYQNINFKTEAEYRDYLAEHNIQAVPTQHFRKSKYAADRDYVLRGKFESFELAPGTVLYDERDLSRYTFETEEEAQEVLNHVCCKDPDCLIQCCLFDGTKDEEVYDPTNEQVKNILANCPVSIGDPFDKEKETKVFMHLVVSYLPNNEALRKQRLDAIHNLFLNIKEITPNARIFVNAQNYKEEELTIDDQITYLFNHEKGIGAQEARNELLKYFYDSEYEYAILHDDDSFLNPTQSAKDFFWELQTMPQKFTRIPMDVCYSRNMLFNPRDQWDIQKSKFRGKTWDFTFCPSSWLCWSVFRNFKKAYGEEYYLDVDMDPKLGVGFDDTDFSYQITSKHASWSLPQLELLLQNQNESDSSLFSDITSPIYRIRSIAAVRNKYLPENETHTNWSYDYFRTQNGQSRHYAIPRVTERDLDADYTEAVVPAIKEKLRCQKIAGIKWTAGYKFR